MIIPLRSPPDAGHSSAAGPTMDRLRHEIDRGQMGDKVAARDPAAAPLGTDEEAAGTPTPLRGGELGYPVSSEPSQLRRQWQRAALIVVGLVTVGLTALWFG